VARANAGTATPVVFVHGLWLLPSSWEPWAKHFEEAGYVTVSPGWPDDPDSVTDAKTDPATSPTRRTAAPDHGAALVERRPEEPGQLQPCCPAHLRAVPLRLRQRRER
jgi:non-heme chloroperoxidase